jgi:outer membrane protein
VLRDGEVLELNRNNEQVLRRQLEATQDRFRVGEVTRTDVAQAEAALAGAVASRIQAEGNLVTSRANFEQVFGFPPANLTQPPLPTDLPRSEDDAWVQAQDQNPDYAAARYREIASKHDIDATTGALLPQFNLVGQLNRSNETTTPNLTTNTAQVLAQVSMPLYEAGNTYSQVRQRKQVNSQRKLQIDETGRQVRRNAVSTWENLLTARANIQSLQAQVDASRIALDGIQQEAAVGSRTVLDVLITEQNLLNSEVALVRARFDEAVASYSLKAVVGTMTAPGMKLPVELYDPTENYKRVRNKWLGLGIGNND